MNSGYLIYCDLSRYYKYESFHDSNTSILCKDLLNIITKWNGQELPQKILRELIRNRNLWKFL